MNTFANYVTVLTWGCIINDDNIIYMCAPAIDILQSLATQSHSSVHQFLSSLELRCVSLIDDAQNMLN